MNSFQFTAISGGDWTERMEGRDQDSNALLTDLDTGEIQIQLQDRAGGVVFTLTTEDGTISRPGSGEFQWIVPASRMSGLCVGTTYYVGCRHINETGGITILWTGSLAYIHGGYEWR